MLSILGESVNTIFLLVPILFRWYRVSRWRHSVPSVSSLGSISQIKFFGDSAALKITEDISVPSSIVITASQDNQTDISIDVAAGKSASIAGSISNGIGSSFTQNFIKKGGGTLLLSGSNTFEGIAVINDGILAVSSEDAFGSAAGLDFTNGTLKIVEDSVFPSSLGVGVAGSSPAVFSIDVDENKSASFAGVFSDIGSPIGSLAKLGLGSLTLTGDNTYTGSTTLFDGAGCRDANGNAREFRKYLF